MEYAVYCLMKSHRISRCFSVLIETWSLFTTNQQEQLEAAQREIAMGNERERQLQGKLLKTKEDLKLEREEVCVSNIILSLWCDGKKNCIDLVETGAHE